MLKYLRIENIAVIESTEIDLSNGFNVMTGETGAGKSIIIDAINAVLGERTSKDLIRAGCDKASVSAVFTNLSKEATDILEENGYELDEDGNLVIMRVLTNSGGMVKIGGKPATVGVLKEISKNLVNIHGQHDSQSLLNPDNHYLYIDKVANNEKESYDYYKEFKNLNAIRKKLSALETNEDEKLKRKEYLEYVVNELENANITVGERDKLKERLSLIDSYEKVSKALNNANTALSGGDDQDGAISLVNTATKCISSINTKEISEFSDSLSRISAELEAIAYGIDKYATKSENCANDKEVMSARLDYITRLMRKYGDSEEKLLLVLKESNDELSGIDNSDEYIKKLSDELDLSTERLINLGEKLTETRVKSATKFSKDVTDILKYLDMANVEFSVNIGKGTYTKHGCDVVEFVVKTNVGEEPKPLHKIASGGELSRIMLAIKSVLADKDDVDTLIFDEIDTGISGIAAGKVGVQLKKVSNSRQVICVTHLAQIASCGNNHLKIEKRVKNDRTYTSVLPLSYDERIEEIARIMSGAEITENLYNSAKELLDRSK